MNAEFASVAVPQRRRFSVAETVVWAIAALFAACVHAGAFAALTSQPVSNAQDSGALPAVMIEFAPLPEAQQTDQTEISPDTVDSAEIVTASSPQNHVVPEEKPLPQALPEAAPLPPLPTVSNETQAEQQTASLPFSMPGPVEALPPDELADVAIPVPAVRPIIVEPQRKAEKREVVKTAALKPTPEAAPSKARTKAKAEVTPSKRNAASQTSSQAGSKLSPARWQSRLIAHLEKRKRYPADARARREEGTAFVRFRIDASGNVLSVSLSRSSGHAALDQAVLAMVQKASPVPAPPAGVNRTITAPVQFNLR